MNNQSIIKNTIECIIKKLEKTVENFPETKIIFEYSDDYTLKNSPIILISFIGIEDVININSNEKILIEEKSQEGKVEQFYIKHPFDYNLKFLITFYNKSKIESCNMLETVLKNFKNNKCLDIDDFDEQGCNKQAQIEVIDFNIFKQVEIFKILNMKYSPSVIIQTKVSIQNDYREKVNIVKRRNFYVIENKKVLN